MAEVEHRLFWSREAEDDLLLIWRFGADEWSPAAADAHEHALWRACKRLIETPHLGRSRDELIRGLRSISVEPHMVFYVISPAGVEIVRVVHQSENVEAIFH